MCEIKTVLIVAALLLAATGFCIYQVKSEKKLGHYSKIKIETPCEKEYKKCCLNGGKCSYLSDEDIIGCKCTWLYGGKHWKGACGGVSLAFILGKDQKRY